MSQINRPDTEAQLHQEFAELKPILDLHHTIAQQQCQLNIIEVQLSVLLTRKAEIERQRQALATTVQEHADELAALRARPLLHRLFSFLEIADKIDLFEAAQKELDACDVRFAQFEDDLKPVFERLYNARQSLESQRQKMAVILSDRDTCLALVLLRASIIKDELYVLMTRRGSAKQATTDGSISIQNPIVIQGSTLH